VVPDAPLADVSQAFRQHGVVLEGRINPAIFQPRWLAAIGVIPLAEADAAEPPVVSASVTAFRTPRLSVQVTSERAVFRTRGDALTAPELATIVHEIFTQLPHTPITSLDLVHEAHVPVELVTWSAARRSLVPEQTVAAVLPGSALGFVQLEMHADDGALVQVLVEASANIVEAMYVRVHREFTLEPVDSESVAQALDLLDARWGASLDEASTILARMVAEFQ
jgi:hypothetical protein